MILKIWKDPVWSKVIAAAIITLFGIIATYAMGIWPSILQISHNVYTFLLKSTLVDNWLLTVMSITRASCRNTCNHIAFAIYCVAVWAMAHYVVLLCRSVLFLQEAHKCYILLVCTALYKEKII